MSHEFDGMFFGSGLGNMLPNLDGFEDPKDLQRFREECKQVESGLAKLSRSSAHWQSEYP